MLNDSVTLGLLLAFALLVLVALAWMGVIDRRTAAKIGALVLGLLGLAALIGRRQRRTDAGPIETLARDVETDRERRATEDRATEAETDAKIAEIEERAEAGAHEPATDGAIDRELERDTGRVVRGPDGRFIKRSRK